MISEKTKHAGIRRRKEQDEKDSPFKMLNANERVSMRWESPVL